MTSRLSPYISFSGEATQAMEFYKEVLGGDLSVNTYGAFGSRRRPDTPTRSCTATLRPPHGFTLMAADNPPGTEHKPGNNFAVSLTGDDSDELRGYWQKLSTGGTVAVPLEKQMWGDVFGMCTDKFGITWMVNISEQ